MREASKRSTAPCYEVRFSVVIAAESHSRALAWAEDWLVELGDAEEAISSSAHVEREPVNEDFHWEARETC